jgi:hypothetical protein
MEFLKAVDELESDSRAVIEGRTEDLSESGKIALGISE